MVHNKVYGSDAAYQVGTDDRRVMLQVDTSYGDAVDICTDGNWVQVTEPVHNLSPTMKNLVHFAKLNAHRYLNTEIARRVVGKLEALFPHEQRARGHATYVDHRR